MPRKSPKVSATTKDLGTVERGLDGNMWKVSVTKNGVYRWVPHKEIVKATKKRVRCEDGVCYLEPSKKRKTETSAKTVPAKRTKAPAKETTVLVKKPKEPSKKRKTETPAKTVPAPVRETTALVKKPKVICTKRHQNFEG